MTKKEIYEQIVQLTSELHVTNVTEKIFSAAKEGDSKKVEEIFETFKKEKHDIHQKIVNLGKEIKQVLAKSMIFETACIFGTKQNEKKGIYVLDSKKIDCPSLFVIMLIAEIEDTSMFEWNSKSADVFINAIVVAGYEELAYFINTYSWIDMVGEDEDQYANWYELLAAVFNDEFE